ncbi:replication initiation protein [Corynebacterium poyangense]|uniref:replication initiation protein n=1 Tax=Corynebacterium poyangense TaxID=2684405 RepID=UPI0021CDC6F8|nr:replication initiation protein [Corynebacterium poyangense]
MSLTSKKHASVIVVDIDISGESGGHPVHLAIDVGWQLAGLVERNIGPAWVGINPLSGKAQALWLIDPAYANPAVGDSRHMRLLAATTQALGEYLGYDPHFSWF